MFPVRICVLLLLVTTTWQVAVQEERNLAMVTVKVLDPARRPVAKARVRFIERSSRSEKEQTTAETGTATIELQPGNFDLTVTSPEFLFLMMRDVEVKRGDHRQLDVVLEATVPGIIDFADPGPLELERSTLGNLEPSPEVRTNAKKPLALTGHVNTSEGVCAETARLRTYSNAVFVEEAGDVVGYEMVLQPSNGNSTGALLYVYEGVPNEDGINVSGRISAGKVAMEGNWVLHLTEEPSKKQIVEIRPIKISGTLNPKRFRGTITISGSAESLTLKRVEHIWGCKPKAH